MCKAPRCTIVAALLALGVCQGTARVGQAIGCPLFGDGSIALEIALDAPDLLRAFIPYAHAQSGIRDELTSRAIAVIDALRTSYKRKVLQQANYWAFGDAV